MQEITATGKRRQQQVRKRSGTKNDWGQERGGKRSEGGSVSRRQVVEGLRGGKVHRRRVVDGFLPSGSRSVHGDE